MVGLSNIKQCANNELSDNDDDFKLKYNIKSLPKTIFRYVISLPLAIIASQLTYWLCVLIWKIWTFMSHPFINGINIDFLTRIDNMIEWFIFTSTSTVVSAIAFFACFYHILPRNRFRPAITYFIIAMYSLIFIYHIIAIEQTLSGAYTSILIILSSLYFGIAITNSTNKNNQGE